LSNRRNTWALVPVLFAAGVLAAPATAATPEPKTLAAYQACLKAHGVTFGGTGARPSAAKMKAAFKACASQAPAGLSTNGGAPLNGRPNRPPLTAAQRAAFAKYQACLGKYGITFKPGVRQNTNSAAFKAADKACASLRPKLPRRLRAPS
jgi:hypothetical protein